MASDGRTLADEDNQYSGWFEIHNPTQEPSHLHNWFATDNPADPEKWQFPYVVLDPDERLVVFASGKERSNDSTQLTRDLHATEDGTFLVDLLDGTYDVRMTIGDFERSREDMGVYIQGQLADVLTTDLGEFATSSYTAEVNAATGGQLAVRFQDLGGPNPRVSIAAIVITPDAGGDPLLFDFGTVGSPVETGFTRVVETDSYSTDIGYGWQPDVDLILNHRDRGDRANWLHANFSLNNHGDYLSLISPDGLTVSEWESPGTGFPLQYRNVSFGLVPAANPEDPPLIGYMTTPTPAEPNAADGAITGPLLLGVTENPGALADDQDLVITAQVEPLNAPVASVSLIYRVMFESEVNVSMSDDGVGHDLVAGDDIYTAVIPATASEPGAMVRWFVSATDVVGNGSRGPFSGLTYDPDKLLIFSEDFETATVNPFAPILGNWSTDSGRYQVVPAVEGEDAISTLSQLGQLLNPFRIDATLSITGQPDSHRNAAVIFDYQSPTDFKTVSIHANARLLRIGRRTSSGWIFAKESAEAIDEDTDYRLTVEIDGPIVRAGLGSSVNLTHNFGHTLHDGLVGLGTKYGIAEFDDIDIRSLEFADDFPIYFGTVVADPQIQTNLPVLHWFVADPEAAASYPGTHASLFFLDEFYDNVHVDLHGQSTSGGIFPKKSFDFDFNAHRKFKFMEGVGRASDINLLTNYADKTKVRNTLAYETYRDALHPYNVVFPIRVERNGEFYSIQDFVEENDAEYLERNGLDPNGALYKINNPLNSTFDRVEKRTRKHEDRSDLQELINGGSTAWYYDNLNIPSWINFLAIMDVIANVDCCHKNFYVYRDSDGTRQWEIHPWDQDLSFGHNWNGPETYFDDDIIATNGLFRSGNQTLDRLRSLPGFYEMYMRRLRSLLDQILQPPGTSQHELKYEARVDAIIDQLGEDAALDQAQWGFHSNMRPQTPAEAVADLKTRFFAPRRNFVYHQSGISPAQIENPLVQFGAFEFNPSSGQQDQEFVELINPHPVAVDISGWRLTGGIEFNFRGGTVIPAHGSLYVTPSVTAFLVRTEMPHGGQRLLVQGDYTGHLSNFGETVQLVAADDSIVSTLNYAGEPSLEQQYLRITEIHYNPPGGDDATEFIELKNISDTVDLDLTGVKITDGLSQPYDFTGSGISSLLPGAMVLVVKDQVSFQAAYPGVDPNLIAGNYQGRLSNGGEMIKLEDGNGGTILEFSYADNDPWPERADGGGASLTLIDAVDTPRDQFGKFYRWQGSIELGGTPGTTGDVPIGVVINEVLTHTGPSSTALDAIELFNTTSRPIDTGGWFLSDSSDNLLKFQIPVETVLGPGEYVVFDESQFNPNPNNPGPNDFALRGTAGDDAWLVNPNGSDGILRFVDDVHFGAAPIGESLGRVPNGTGRLTPLQVVTLGSDNGDPRIGPLVISEIHYHPTTPSSNTLDTDRDLVADDLEFVEIYNPTGLSVEMTGWRLRGGVDFDFPAGTTIGPGSFLVLLPLDPQLTANAQLLVAWRAHYEFHEDVAWLGPYLGQLSNGGERILLQRPDAPPITEPLLVPYLLEDEVVYDDLAPWPTAADGTGSSLQRNRVDLLGNKSDTWLVDFPSPGRFRAEKSFVLTPGTTIIGEVGNLTGVTHEPQLVTLTQAYNNPVVFAQPASFIGTDPVVVRVSDVQSNQFKIFLAEPSNLNGFHNTGEIVSYLVLEAGNHVLADGTELEVGTLTTDATVGKAVTLPSWANVDLTTSFAASPVVLSQPQTSDGQAFLSTRHNAVMADSFQVALQQEEQITSSHGFESVGYLVVDAGVGIWNGMKFEAYTTPPNITEAFTRLDFDQVYSDPPSFISSLASFNGKDNAHLRYGNLHASHVELKVEEDTTQDQEILHVAETAAYVAIGGEGILTAVANPLADGQTRTFGFNISEMGRVNDLDFAMQLINTRAEDLDISLEAPDGTMVELLTDVGGEGDSFNGTTLDDEAAQSITSGLAPFSGRYRPEGVLRKFDGKQFNGTWKLHIADDTSNGVVGAIIQWSLDIQLGPDPEGNLNYDGNLDATDIDLLLAHLGSSDPSFDMDHDGDADQEDVQTLVEGILGRRFGDTNLDQKVDILDADVVRMNFDPGGTNPHNGWSRGDFEGDGDIDLRDLHRIILNFAPDGYSVPSDFKNNLFVDPLEIDLLYTKLGSTDPSFDRNHDEIVDPRTALQQVSNIIRTHDGDWYRDGMVDADIGLTTFFSNYGSHTKQPDRVWSQGDFDGDGDVGVDDFFSEDFQLEQALYRWHVVD